MNEFPGILFVDDDTNLLDSFRRHFGRSFEVVTAASAEEALKILDTGRRFSAIISDQRMPGMDGASLLGEISRREPLAARILLTGLSDQPVAVRAINEGHVFAFLQKPVPLEMLEETINEAVDTWKIRKHEKDYIDREMSDIAFL